MQAYADPYDRADALIEQFLGTRYIGRRYVRFSELIDLGVVDNRATLTLWIESGVFPKPIKLAGPTGKSLRWVAVEVAQLIAKRLGERDQTANETGVPAKGRPSDFDSSAPLRAGHREAPICAPKIPAAAP
jgi:predicted DNA-binding transcriptional regulator AlpA